MNWSDALKAIVPIVVASLAWLLTALGQLPYTHSFQIIQAIHNQAIPQIQAANAEKVEPEVANG